MQSKNDFTTARLIRNQGFAMAVPAILEHGRDAGGTRICAQREEL